MFGKFFLRCGSQQEVEQEADSHDAQGYDSKKCGEEAGVEDPAENDRLRQRERL